MKTNLTKAITIHSAYGVEVEYENGTVCRVDVNQPLYNYTEKTISVHVAIQDIENKEAKLLLHSLDKLTQEIDGKVGIVELAKVSWGNIDWEVGKDCAKNELHGCHFKYHSLDNSFSCGDGQHWAVNNQLELFNYLLANHYNVFGLSSEYFKEKSISKNNGSRDIGLVDMMDIDTY